MSRRRLRSARGTPRLRVESLEMRLLLAGGGVPPAVTGIEYATASPVAVGPVKYLVVHFNADVGASLDLADVHVRNVSAGADVAPASLAWDAGTKSAVIQFSSATPAEGNYTLTLTAAGISDTAGTPLDGDADGQPGGNFTAWFSELPGDANADHTVNFDDLLALAKHYNATGQSLPQGDFNSDGIVNFDDLLILAKNYNGSLARSIRVVQPNGGAPVTGIVDLGADPSDARGLAGVQFFVNGAPVGAEDTSAPYALTWDSTAVANGTYQVTAVARGTDGKTVTSEPVGVTVANTAQALSGQWSDVMDWPLVAINTVLLKDGRVLMWDGDGTGDVCIGPTSARVWDPATNRFTPVPIPYFTGHDDDIFCSAQTLLADGRVLVVGGHDCDGPGLGIKATQIFDPATMTWTRGPDMHFARWYPTATTLADGRVLILGGSTNTTLDYVDTPEIYDPATNTVSELPNATLTIPSYSFVFQNPDGRVIVTGSDEAKMPTYALDVATQTWSTVDPTVLDAGSGVMYRPGTFLKAGSSYLSAPLDNGGSVPSKATTYVLDTTQPGTPKWQQTASMANARTHLNLTLLPDGTVLATGGSSDIGGLTPANGVYPAELWSPVTQTWTTLASMQTPRMYHSTATLLPDGRILVAGGGRLGPDSFLSAEIYSPPYLFRGPRPVVTSAPSAVDYGTDFFVATPDGARIASVALLDSGATTHSFNMNQRYVPLTYDIVPGGLRVHAPADPNLAPAGNYMLFVVDSHGVPSMAPFVQVRPDAQPPTPPANPVATGSINSARVRWDASADNTTVMRYEVYRSTAPNFVPSSTNLVGQSTSTSFVDASVAPGTYYYKVIAIDARGNAGAASVAAQATVIASPIRMVQHAANGFESSVSSISLAFPTNVTAGDFLIVTGTAARPRHAITISDSAGNTYLPAIGPVSDPAQDVTAYVWYVVSAKGGADTITLTPGGGADAMEIHISEWSGINKANPVDQTSFATGTGTQINSGTRTTTQNGELVFGYTFPNQNSTAGAGFTGLSYINGDLDEYLLQGAAGPVAATFTQQADAWMAMMVTFRPEDPDAQPPTAPAGLTASGAVGAVHLSWSAATDNNVVDHYDIYRSTSPDFIPAPANQVGQTAGTSYDDAGLAGSTYYYYVVAQDAAGNMGPASNRASADVTADTTPPTVTLSGPVAGGTVSGTVTLSAGASDDVGVAGVRFLIDGVQVGADDTTAPYSLSWNSRDLANGTHALTAVAFDASGNSTTSDAVSFTIANTGFAGLIASFGFDEGSGTVAGDGSGNGHSGAISNATWTSAGKFGGALSFNGTSSIVDIADADALDLTTGMTLEAWVRPTSLSGYRTVIMKDVPGELSYSLYASGDVNRPNTWGRVDGTSYDATGTTALALNTWTHLASTYDGTTLRLFVNGVQVASRAISGWLQTSDNLLHIGGNAIWGEYFAGLIDEVRIYDRALTAAQIQTDMNAPVAGAAVTAAVATVEAVAAAVSTTGPTPFNVSVPVDSKRKPTRRAADSLFLTGEPRPVKAAHPRAAARASAFRR